MYKPIYWLNGFLCLGCLRTTPGKGRSSYADRTLGVLLPELTPKSSTISSSICEFFVSFYASAYGSLPAGRVLLVGSGWLVYQRGWDAQNPRWGGKAALSAWPNYERGYLRYCMYYPGLPPCRMPGVALEADCHGHMSTLPQPS
jgi:hypothetical protein